MRTHRSPSRSPVALVIAAVVAVAAQQAGAAQRTFVSVSGTDNASCSLAAPCRTFTAAISATSAGGEVIVLDSGGYGAVTIGKSVSITAPTGVYAGISVFSGDGVTISAATTDTVILRGLAINNQGGNRGIAVLSAATVRIEDCVINGMTYGIVFAPANTATLVVSATTVRNSTQIGILAGALSGGDLSRLEIWRSDISQTAGDGIYISDITRASISESLVADNLAVASSGIHFKSSALSATSPSLVVDHTQVVGNSNGVVVHGIGSVTSYANISQSAISNNQVYGVEVNTLGNVRLSGNQITGNGGSGTAAFNTGVLETLANNLRRGNSPEGSGATTLTPY